MIQEKIMLEIENATSFKLEYYLGGSELKEKEFTSYKTIEQFNSRQTDFLYLDCNRYAFINNEWQRFIKLNSPIVFQKDIDLINKRFNDVVEDSNLQKYQIE